MSRKAATDLVVAAVLLALAVAGALAAPPARVERVTIGGSFAVGDAAR